MCSRPEQVRRRKSSDTKNYFVTSWTPEAVTGQLCELFHIFSILLSKQNTSSEVNLLQTRGSTVIRSISRVGEISSKSTSPSINISSQLSTDSFIDSTCQVVSSNQPQQLWPVRTQQTSYVNCSASAEKELKTVPFNHPIHLEDVTVIVAKEKARSLHRTASRFFIPRHEFSPGEFSLFLSLSLIAISFPPYIVFGIDV